MRIIVYDPTDTRLSKWWKLGAHLYFLLDKNTKVVACASTRELEEFLLTLEPNTIYEIQFWCHGSPGKVHLGGTYFAADDPVVFLLSQKLTTNAIVWFRCCSNFSGEEGQAFATTLVAVLRCTVAAHTYDIGYWGLQSGLRVVSPDQPVYWDPEEGKRSSSNSSSNSSFYLSESSLDNSPFTSTLETILALTKVDELPEASTSSKQLRSNPFAPSTITIFHRQLPSKYRKKRK